MNSRSQTHCSAALLIALAVALTVLGVCLIPLVFSFVHEQTVCRSHYNHAIAMEIVDGEMELLVAGEWREFKEGSQPYMIRAGAAKNLPPSQFILTRQGKHLRLEWVPDKAGIGG